MDYQGAVVRDGLLAPERYALSILRENILNGEISLLNSGNFENETKLLNAWLKHLGGVGNFIGIHAPAGLSEAAFEDICGKALLKLFIVRIHMKGESVSWKHVRNEAATLSSKDKMAMANAVLYEVRNGLRQPHALAEPAI
jgi:hypothetical protein